MRVTGKRLIHFLDKYGLDYELAPGWNDPRNDPYKGQGALQGIVLHHTAGIDSEAWVIARSAGYPYKPYRACHDLSRRDGSQLIVAWPGAYHAGEGGPLELTRTTPIPRNGGNSRLIGIEIESLGTSARIDGKREGMTLAQVVETSMLCVAYLDAISPVPGVPYSTKRVILHRTWTTRKIDVRQDLDWWRHAIRIARHNRAKPAIARELVADFARDEKSGRLAA
ncbi:MAG: N-acetylmuramoyl-L-alanine amidase [Actinomycetota bacterium]|nr:N-acetylmuramoyl-L-alanine amidase [Actinomycetota bacterium]